MSFKKDSFTKGMLIFVNANICSVFLASIVHVNVIWISMDISVMFWYAEISQANVDMCSIIDVINMPDMEIETEL